MFESVGNFAGLALKTDTMLFNTVRIRKKASFLISKNRIGKRRTSTIKTTPTDITAC
jgi:hypothetical protein